MYLLDNCFSPSTNTSILFDLRSIGNLRSYSNLNAVPTNVSSSGNTSYTNVLVVLSNFIATCIDLVSVSPSIALAIATEPPSSWLPSSITVGALVYPTPGLVTSIFVTLPRPMYALAVAPDPPPPSKITFGGYVYFDPAS